MTSAELSALGLDPLSLKARFDTDKLGEVEQRLVRRWKNRVEAGRQWNLRHWRVYHAVDRAWDSDFYQAPNTMISLLKEVADSKNEKEALEVASRLQMTHLIVPDIDGKTGKPTGKKRLSIPTFYEIIIALARNYTLMRVSRLATERLQVPLFKYEPAMSTELNKARAEVLTQRVDAMARDYGYGATLDQAIQYAGMYGHQLQFVAEEWHRSNRLTTVIDPVTGQAVLGQELAKEGLRFNLPHPSRTYFDLDFPLWTLNTDTGCRYAGYWSVTTYGALRQNSQWWNIQRIHHSRSIGSPEWRLYFETTGQCRMALGPGAFQAGGTLDRMFQTETGFYANSEDDVPVWTSEHFELINLRADFGEQYPDVDVWFRVVLASDDTPIYVTPLPDRPATAWLWEPTDNRAIQAGMMLAVIPFQDHVTNLFTQSILSAKQNLANVTLFDNTVVDPARVREDLMNPNETLYRKLNFWEVHGGNLKAMQANLDQVFRSYKFPPQDVGQHLQIIGQLLSMLERVLGMSAQEVGSYASHEQSAEEVRTIHTNTGHRYEHIASWLDRAIEAWKAQLYSYLMAFGSLDAYAYISPELVAQISKAGFQLIDEGPKGVQVKAPIGALRVEQFIAQRDGPNRVPGVQLGSQMVQLITTFLASPATQQLFGPDVLVRMLNNAFELLGMPRNFRLDPQQAQAGMVTQFQQYLQEQLQNFAGQAKQYVDESQQKLLAELAGAANQHAQAALPAAA